MAKLSTLKILIASLTKGERRYFKLNATLQNGGKDYVFLFGLFDKQLSQEEIKKQFKQKKPATSFEATAKYLYKVLTDCLLHVRTEQDKTKILTIKLLKVEILFEKSIYDEVFKQLENIQKEAEQNELYIILLWACRLEIYYMSTLNFYNSNEAELIKKQMRIREIIKYAKNINEHHSLNELLQHRLLHKGSVRTPGQKQALNDLVVTELNLVSNPNFDTFESQKIHLLFQANYFITINDYKSALSIFYELNKLFEENRLLWKDSAIYYISAVEGILDSLRAISSYNEMDYFLTKLEVFETDLPGLQLQKEAIIFIYRISGLLTHGKFDEALFFIKNKEETFLNKLNLLNLKNQAEIYLYLSVSYLVNDNINKAHFYLNMVLLQSDLFYSLPIYRIFRVIHLLIQYQLNNHEVLAYEIRSIKRNFKNNSKDAYLLEKAVFRFVSIYPLPGKESEKIKLWQKMEADFALIKADKYGMEILKIFDFGNWIKSKVLKVSFGKIVTES